MECVTHVTTVLETAPARLTQKGPMQSHHQPLKQLTVLSMISCFFRHIPNNYEMSKILNSKMA
jgi:hypothetical protein